MKIYTVQDVAAMIGVTDARIRQLCIQHKLGRIIGNTRILSRADIAKIKKTKRKPQNVG